jgi:hypothetical protein
MLRRSRRPLLPVLGPTVALVLALVMALLAGCSSSDAATRTPGDPVTADEAAVLADLLHQNFEAGGADFTETAPFADGAVLTLTGSLDFRSSTGRGTAVTSYTNGQPSDTRSVFFTAKDIWFGDIPGLPDALAGAGLPAAQYVRRPLAAVGSNGQAQLVDVLAQVVLNLSSRSSDDPRSFQQGGYTWQGSRSIDGRLANVYGLAGGGRVAVGSDKRMLQYVAPLPGQQFQVTITLPTKGQRTIDLPSDAHSVDATQHPDVAAKVGV